MKLTLRPEWKLWPLSSFLGFLDLKTGVTLALMFAVLNKVAGVYGLIAVATGAGGSFAQISLYIYSVIALIALVWGFKAVKEEDPKQTLYFAHLYFADHIFCTSWTVFFAVMYWFKTPHDGRRQVNSASQLEIIKMTPASDVTYSDEERVRAALEIWNHEKGTALAVIIFSWLFKIYFSILLYSYAIHLRKGSYRSLPRSRHNPGASVANTYDTSLGLEDDEIEDFYRVPLRTPNTANSTTSYADFVNAPQSRKSKSPVSEDVLFDEDETTMYTSSSRPHSKLGRNDSSSSR